ncbi:MAG: hypothetical protein IPK52_27265 [Chloroflexi bacterium]|nr:hypothetical protein [Chloroflexota bacterium]
MYAETQGKKIFPLLIKGDTKSSLPILLINAQHINLLDFDFQTQLEKLTVTLKHLVGVKSISPYILTYKKNRPGWKKAYLRDIAEVSYSTKRYEVEEGGVIPVYGIGGIIGYSKNYEFEGDYILVLRHLGNSRPQFTKNAWENNGGKILCYAWNSRRSTTGDG